ncbi:MAG: L,D-transpeptidase [Muribaculaceae bacterium]|nr:L,D-transpeptidase [Muribaculaceae bacterium]
MVNNTTGSYRIISGDCPWNVAKRNLQAKGGKVNNMLIIEEMNRLAKINGCDDVDDFSRKFFYSIGKELILEEVEDVEPDVTPIKPDNPEVPDEPARPATTEEAEVERINRMDNDTDRIVEYNKTHYKGEHYGIVDKKTCKLKIYDKEGNVVKTIPVGVGKAKGDYLGSGYLSSDPAKREGGRYTTPGECTLDEYETFDNANYVSRKDGKHKIMALKGDNMGEDAGQQAIHMIPRHRRDRKHALDTETASDNRMSYGCVNLREEDYDIMAQYLGEGDKIYILPEEKGNKLQLEKQADGSYRFEQQYHKDQKRGVNKDVACHVNYNVRPDRDPARNPGTSSSDWADLKHLLAGLLGGSFAFT